MQKNSNTMKIVINFCGGWGYDWKFNQLKKELIKEYPNVIIEGIKANSITGEFEIFLNGKLIYSKLKTHKFPNIKEIKKIVESS